MKQLMMMSLFVLAFACGKNNNSGQPTMPPSGSPYALTNEQLQVRQDFVNRGNELLNMYGRQIDYYVGQNASESIRSQLYVENIDISNEALYSDYSRSPVRSSRRNSHVVLYAGNQYPDQNWNRYFRQRNAQLDQYIMHEMLEMIAVNDQNFYYTNQILGQRRGR